ncbi:transmembrane signal receptor [Lithospermum erythrorhizon]|uniref:Transmembrane signal receptor n=1 Tax=Lithospermum erythrorhizon TaxID=34254 RepID=A0AAV3RU47_LITER
MVKQNKLGLIVLDVKNAFLHEDLHDKVYIYQPLGCRDPVYLDYVCNLKKSLYGLKWCFLSQKKYADAIITCASMSSCNSSTTPNDTKSKLGGASSTLCDNPSLFRSLVGALQYLTFTRPDISYPVQRIYLFMDAPMTDQIHALKLVLRYIEGTLDYGLHLYKSPVDTLTSYTDVDWAGCPDTRRSTFGFCVFLGDNLISWSSKHQATIYRSNVEAEYHGLRM